MPLGLAAKVIAFLVASIGLVGSIYGIWGPPWPTEPVFAPGNASLGSPFDVPFLVTNKSALFRLNNLSIICEIIAFEAISSDGKAGIRTAPNARETKILARGVNPFLAAGESRPFTCPIRGLMILGANREDAADKVTKAQIMFISEYDFILFWHAKSTSGVFTLNTSTTPPQWMPGEPLK
jgi:hypothetical protein